jgi:hypothetical protein
LSDQTHTTHMSSGAPLPTVQGLRTRDLWRNQKLRRQPGPSSWRSAQPTAPVFTGPHWTLFFDDSSRKQGWCGGTAPHSTWGPVQVYGTPGLQSNQQHGGVRSPALWVKYNLVTRGSTAPRERRLTAHHQVSQGRLLLQRSPVSHLSALRVQAVKAL